MFKYLAATLFAIVAIQSAAASPTSAVGVNEQCGSASGIVACDGGLQCCFIATNYGVCLETCPIHRPPFHPTP